MTETAAKVVQLQELNSFVSEQALVLAPFLTQEFHHWHKRRLKGDLFNTYKYLKHRCRDGARLFSVVPGDRTRSNAHKLNTRSSTSA